MSTFQFEVSGENLAELRALLGPTLVLSTESANQFEQIFDKLLDSLKVQDIVEGILVRDFAEASWEIHRYSRLRSLTFERSFKQSLDFQVQRAKLQHARRQEQIENLAQHATMKPADIAQATHLEQKLSNCPADVGEILARTPTELDHAHALEKAVFFHKEVEIVIASISRRRNEALRLLELYRAGLGKRVDAAMNDIIDVEHQTVEEPVELLESPSAVPSLDPVTDSDRTEEGE